MDRIEELRRLEGAATPGPWSVGYDDGSGETSIVAREEEDRLGLDATVVMGGSPEGDITYGAKSPIDAAFIAAARNALPLLLDVVEAARPVIDYAKAHEPANRQDFERLEAALAATHQEGLMTTPIEGSAWLIERSQPEGVQFAEWFTLEPDETGFRSYQGRWTRNAWEAQRFGSSEDAAEYIRRDGLTARPVKHGFVR